MPSTPCYQMAAQVSSFAISYKYYPTACHSETEEMLKIVLYDVCAENTEPNSPQFDTDISEAKLLRDRKIVFISIVTVHLVFR